MHENPDYSLLDYARYLDDRQLSTANPRFTNTQQSGSLSTRATVTAPPRHDSLDRDSSDFNELGAPSDPEQSSSNTGRSLLTRVPISSYAHTSKDPQHPKGATEDTLAKGNAAHHPSARTQDAQAPPGHHSEEQHDQTLENKKTMPRGFGFARAFKDVAEDFMSSKPRRPPQAPPKDKYLQLLEEYHRLRDECNQSRVTIENYDRELTQLRSRTRVFDDESQRYKDTINGLQNELNDVHQQLEDAKALSEVHEKKLSGAQVDTLSIAEVGEKVSALNEEIFQAAATLGESLIHKHHEEVSQTDLEAAAAVAQEMFGEKMTNILIAQSQKPELEVHPLLVQVIIQILMVKFCASKIQSWYPGDSAIGEILSSIYSNIRSTGKHPSPSRFDSKSCFA